MQQKKARVPLTSRDPRERFIELARARVAKCLKDMRLISNLANRRNYQYTDGEAKKIIKALEQGLDGVKAEFKGKRRPEDNFDL